MDGSLYDMLRNHLFNGQFLNANNEWKNYSVYGGSACQRQQISPISSFHIGDRFSSDIEYHLGNSNYNSLSGNLSNLDYVGNKGQWQQQQQQQLKVIIPTSSTAECSSFHGAPHILSPASVDSGNGMLHYAKRGRAEDGRSIQIPSDFLSQIVSSPTSNITSTHEMENVHKVPYSSRKNNLLTCTKCGRVTYGCSIQIPASFGSQIILSPASDITSILEMENVDNAPSSPKNNLLGCAECGRMTHEHSIQISTSFGSQNVSSLASDFTSTLEMDNVGVHADNVPFSSPEVVIFDNEEIKCKDGTNLDENLNVFQSVSLEDDSMKTESRKGVALTDFFTSEELRKHLQSLRQNMNKSSLEVHQVKELDCASIDSCQLCALGKLFFAPPPIYCSLCSARIKHNANYYCTVNPLRHCFCTSCYRGIRRRFSLNGSVIFKATLTKTKNEVKDDEAWVQCDRCQMWQHQICALFNEQKNLDEKAEYSCPNCSLKTGTSRHIPAAACFCAKDLPKSELSDHIEQRILRVLRQERLERASVAEKNYEEVPGVEDLTVRVVSSVKEHLKVGEKFLSLFRDDEYPSELPYDSKAIFMFQKIDGADVCLFAMYVQEFGPESPRANRNCVYISYIDSVKHFSPDIKSACGESLRTIVYHNILLGYFEYCKNIGFTTGYIWSSPPKGYREEYIFYCHPENQKTPKTDYLRKWYISVLKKAVEQKIAMGFSNLHDQLFSEPNPTAARLPHFEGAYWTTAAEGMIKAIDNISRDELLRRAKKIHCRRNCTAMGKNGLSVRDSRHVLLMDKMEEDILPFRDDFFVVNFQSAVSSNPPSAVETHCKDPSLGNSLFKTRLGFLTTCEERRYQFDTLRRAKHSTMMILYHFQTSCLSNEERNTGC